MPKPWRLRALCHSLFCRLAQALYGIGFLLACIYHVCHMDEAGLIASSVFGISGPIWRSADVYMAQWLLSRMWGHALKASHPVTSGVHQRPSHLGPIKAERVVTQRVCISMHPLLQGCHDT